MTKYHTGFLLRILVCIIFFFGLFLRIYKFEQIPYPHTDEMAFGYSAYSLSITGADEHGAFLPLVLKSFGDFKLGILAYFLVPAVKILGLSLGALRFFSVGIGLLTILITYKFLSFFLKNKKLAGTAALLLLISPWHIVFSRTVNEVPLQIFLSVSGFYCWAKYIHSRKLFDYLLTLVCLGLAMFSYYSGLFFIPLTSLCFLFLLHKKINLWQASIPVVLCLLLGIFIAHQPLNRISALSLIEHGEVTPLLAEDLQEDVSGSNLFVVRAYHNKVIKTAEVVLRNYFKQISYDFLFYKGDEFFGRYSIPNSGPLYFWELPLICIGLFLAGERVVRYHDGKYLFIVIWVLLVFATPAFSFTGTSTQRTALVIPMVELITALGFWGLVSMVNSIHKTRFKYLLFLALGMTAGYFNLSFSHEYFVHQLKRQPWHRNQYGPDLVNLLDDYAPKFKTTVIPDDSLIYFLFYRQVDPHLTQSLLKPMADNNVAMYRVQQFGNYLLTLPHECPHAGKEGILYVCAGGTIAANSRILDVLYFSDHTPARIFLTFEKNPVANEKYDRINVYPDTVLTPKILPEKSESYFEM